MVQALHENNTGFYGVRNGLWFIGCTGYGTGIETERVNEWLAWGHDENLKMLAHRRMACRSDRSRTPIGINRCF